MEMLKIETGFAVKFPLVLDNDFRTIFPGANWNPTIKQWELIAASESRLRQWVEEVNAAGLDQLVAEVDAEEMGQAELQYIKKKLAQLKVEIRDRLEELDGLPRIAAYTKKTVEELEKCKKTLLAAEQQIGIEKAAIQADRERIDRLLAGVIDMAEVRRLAEIMEGDAPLDDRAKAQAEIEKYRMQLAKAGWSCRAINGLCRWNVNRRDRINLLESDWYNIGRYVKPSGRCRI